MLADRWQSNPNTGTGQGQGKTIRGDRIHTADKIITVAGGGERGRGGGREDSTGHRTDSTREEAVSQT